MILVSHVPLDKIEAIEEYAPTHQSVVLHSNGHPIACILDNTQSNQERYEKISKSNLKASITGFLNKDDKLGLLFGFKLRIKTDDDFFEYTVYPNEEFVDTVIFDESICIIDKKLNTLFYLKNVITDQFVKSKTEFDKFKKILSSESK